MTLRKAKKISKTKNEQEAQRKNCTNETTLENFTMRMKGNPQSGRGYYSTYV